MPTSPKIPDIRKTEYSAQSRKAHNSDALAPLFLTRSQIAQLLNMSESHAKKLLAEHGITPIDLGRGRGKGLRWRTAAVIELADILHTDAQAKKKPRRVKSSGHSVLGKSASELFAEFNGSNSVNAEVCNGN